MPTSLTSVLQKSLEEDLLVEEQDKTLSQIEYGGGSRFGKVPSALGLGTYR